MMRNMGKAYDAMSAVAPRERIAWKATDEPRLMSEMMMAMTELSARAFRGS